MSWTTSLPRRLPAPLTRPIVCASRSRTSEFNSVPLPASPTGSDLEANTTVRHRPLTAASPPIAPPDRIDNPPRPELPRPLALFWIKTCKATHPSGRPSPRDEFSYAQNYPKALLGRPTDCTRPIVKQFIRNVRAAKTIADERAVIQKESAAIRASFREETGDHTVRYVMKPGCPDTRAYRDLGATMSPSCSISSLWASELISVKSNVSSFSRLRDSQTSA